MDIETNNFVYNYTCPECGKIVKVNVKFPKDLLLPEGKIYSTGKCRILRIEM